MEQHINVLYSLLNKANTQGVFTLSESEAAIVAMGQIKTLILGPPPNKQDPEETE